jgi:hypothetical protein
MYLFKWIAGLGLLLGLIRLVSMLGGVEGLFLASVGIAVLGILVLVSVALSVATLPKRRQL